MIGIKILSLSVFNPIIVTGVSPARHMMVNKGKLEMEVAGHIVAGVLLKAEIFQDRCDLLCMS